MNFLKGETANFQFEFIGFIVSEFTALEQALDKMKWKFSLHGLFSTAFFIRSSVGSGQTPSFPSISF